MSKVRIYGDTSGYVDIAVPSVAGTRTLNLDKVPQTATNGNTGIGTDTPFTRAVVGDGTGTEVLTIFSGATGEGQLRFADASSGTGAYQGRVEYDHNAGKLNLGAGGATPVTIDSSGNFGIGTNSPSQNLHVSSTDHTRVLITGGTDKYAELQFENDAQKFAMGVQNDDKFFLYNSTGTSQVLTVDTSNNVGIGTQTPEYPLHVSGSNVLSGGGLATLGIYDSGTAYDGTNPGGGITFRGKYNNAGSFTNFATVQGIKENTTDGNYATALRFTTRENGGNLAEHMRIASNGVVTFKTDATFNNGNNFVIASFMPATSGGESSGILFGSYPADGYAKQGIFWERYSGFTGNYGRGKLHFVNRDATDDTVPTTADARITIDEAGRVGINETNPATVGAKLTVRGDAGANAIFVGGDSTSGNSWGMGINAGSTSADASFRIYDKDGSASYFYVRGDGNIGIGCTPENSVKLEVNAGADGAVAISGRSDGGNGNNRRFNLIPYADGGGANYGGGLKIQTRDSVNVFHDSITVQSNGYVGINTTSPQRALHIHDHAATGLHITNTQSGSGANDGFSQYIRDDNQATELMVRENSYLGFGTNNTLRAQIENSGEFFWPEIGNRGDLTFPICSISNSGAGARYLHAQFQVYGGDMYHIHFLGYDYSASIRQGSGGGYMYNTSGQTSAFNGAYSGNCVAVHQTTTNRAELVIDTGSGNSSNRWGSMVFFGGTDTITGNHPIKLVQYAWNAYTTRLYSS